MHGVVLVGHGAVPKDMPREWVRELKEAVQLGDARAAELDARVRSFPRTDETDPYRAGLLALGDRLRPRLGGRPLVVAFNEFCAPSLTEALAGLVERGATRITVLTTMITRGGSHSERDIPEALEAARARHPGVVIEYAWPFDLDKLAEMFAGHVPTL